MRNHKIPLIISIALAAGFAYLLFRTVLEESESEHPITFELFAALIGVTITVLLTSILLKRQTEAELKKEENIMFLELKMRTYRELIDQLYDIISKKKVLEEDMIEIRLLNQKLAFIASQDVLLAFREFSQCFASMAVKPAIGNEEIDVLLVELSKLSFHIRQDMLLNPSRSDDDPAQIRKAILENNQILDIE